MAKTFILQPERNKGAGDEICELRISEFLNLMNNEYDYFYDEPYGSLTYEEMLQVPIKHCSINLGRKGITAFGFVFSYVKDHGVYTVRLLSPSISEDWRYAIDFIKDFSSKFNCKIFGDDGKSYTYDTIEDFDFRSDILKGLDHLKEMFEKYNMEKVHLGTRDIVTLDWDTVNGIINGAVPVFTFDNFIKENVENIDLRPEQNFYIAPEEAEAKGMFGYYRIPVGKDFVLKVSPNIEPRNNSVIGEYGELQNWFVQFQVEDGRCTPPLDYFFLINMIPAERVKYFGYDNILVKGLLDPEIAKIYMEFSGKIRELQDYCANFEEAAVYDYFRWHYDMVMEKELDVGRLATVNYMTYFLRFCVEHNMVSDYFRKYYPFVEKYLKIRPGAYDFREIVLYSVGGRLDSILLNEKGNRFAEICFKGCCAETPMPEFADLAAEKHFGDEYDRDGAGYLFPMYTEEYYFTVREVLSSIYLNNM